MQFMPIVYTVMEETDEIHCKYLGYLEFFFDDGQQLAGIKSIIFASRTKYDNFLKRSANDS